MFSRTMGLKDLGESYDNFIWFGNYNCSQFFEVIWPVSQVDTSIRYSNDVDKAVFMLQNGFEMVPRQFVQAQSGQIIAAADRDFELLL